MKRKSFLVFSFIFIVALAYLYSFQFTPDELSQRKKWENFLKSAKIIHAEDVGEGITKPKKFTLKEGDIEGAGVWKNPMGMSKGFKESWKYEIAAYKLDKYLKLNMVPPTVEKRYKLRKGSLQLWVPGLMSELRRAEKEITIPADKKDYVTRMLHLARAFDSLIANIDRTQQNICYTEDWRLILIDHSRGFRSSRTYTDQLIYGKKGLRKRPFASLPRLFVEKVKTLDFSTIERVVGDYLTRTEIKCVLARKKLLLKEVEEMIKDHGEGALYE